MRFATIVAACGACCLVAGCEDRLNKMEAGKQVDTELVNVLNDIGLENAIIAQHTLYPYHFTPDGQELNDLGARDFAVLARHLQSHPGVLNIRHGDVSAELYKARVIQITEKLTEAGIRSDRVTISDGMPGGTGMSTERTVRVLVREQEERASQPPAGNERVAP